MYTAPEAAVITSNKYVNFVASTGHFYNVILFSVLLFTSRRTRAVLSSLPASLPPFTHIPNPCAPSDGSLIIVTVRVANSW